MTGREFESAERLTLGLVVERRRIESPWQEHAWRAVAVFPGAKAMAADEPWPVLEEGPERTLYHAGSLVLDLHRKETEGYKVNLSQAPPRLFVVLRQNEDPDIDREILPFKLTACPYEAQDYLDSGEEIVEAVAMPDGVLAFVQGFCDQHHVDQPFKKRKRKPHDPRKEGFSGGRRDERRPPRGEGFG